MKNKRYLQKRIKKYTSATEREETSRWIARSFRICTIYRGISAAEDRRKIPFDKPQWRSFGKVARSERASVVSKATSCFSRPLSHLCLSNPASRSILAFDGAPILAELRWKPAPTPLPSLSARCTRYFPLPSSLDPQMNPPLRRVAFDRISDGARGVADNVYDLDGVSTNRMKASKRRVRVRVTLVGLYVGFYGRRGKDFAK